MCGTAAEVTPLRSIDDHEIGVGAGHARDPEGVPRHGARQERAAGRTGSTTCRSSRAAEPLSTATTQINLCAPWIDERDEELVLEVLRSGWLSLGPTGPRFEALLRRRGRCAVLRRGLVRHRGPASLHAARGRRARRRGDHVAVLVRRLGELRDLRGRDAGLRRHRPADVQPRPGRGRGGDHAAHEGDRRGRHLRLPVRVRRAARALRAARARARRGRVRGARRASTRAGRSARTAIRRSGRSIRTSR